MQKEIKSLVGSDFEKIFGENLSSEVHNRILDYKMLYRETTLEERDYCVRRSVDFLLDKNFVQSGEHRLDQWEAGWRENLESFSSTRSRSSNIPKYFGKYPFVRFAQRFLKVESENLEYNLLGVLLDWLFSKYMKDAASVYEFGCGTGHNLLRLRDFNPTAELWGLDWAASSQKILGEYRKSGLDKNIFSHRFDYFNPDQNFTLAENSVVYTVASLEQVGSRFESFVSYLIKQRPKLVVHIEPIGELLDASNLLDYLSIEYFKKRNYLSGYLTYLRQLESQKKIEILEARRSYIGSFFIDGYSVIVWKPEGDV